MSVSIKYHHVDGHMEKHLLWHKLTLEQNMTTRCVTLAKRAVHSALMTGMWTEGKQLLPRENAAVSVDNRNLTRDLEKAVRYKVGKEQARNYLISQEDWTGKQFDEVDWNRMYGALGNTPEG